MGLFGRDAQGVEVPAHERGAALVVDVDPRVTDARSSTSAMTLVVMGPGGRATAVHLPDVTIRRSRWPARGQVLPVRVPSGDPRRPQILWDEVPEVRERARVEAQAIAEALTGGGAARLRALMEEVRGGGDWTAPVRREAVEGLGGDGG